jgi:heme-degrading monooxygenase HmoA
MVDEVSFFAMGLWTVKLGKEEDFVSSWQTFAKWTVENQRGAIEAYLTHDRKDPNVFVSFSSWTSDEALARWRETEEFKDFFARGKDLCTDMRPLTLDTVTRIGTNVAMLVDTA